jgi:hypothetical protein
MGQADFFLREQTLRRKTAKETKPDNEPRSPKYFHFAPAFQE